FQLSTNPPTADAYGREGVDRGTHILLDYDQDDTFVNGKVTRPPKLQGLSGGGIFHVSRESMDGPLVAIATEQWKRSRFVVGTRIKYFVAAARQLRSTRPPEMFE